MTAWLLKALAERPEGEKVAVAAIARARGLDQATVIAAIEKLIATGKVDRLTLRPAESLLSAPSTPTVADAAAAEPVARPDLYDAVFAESVRRGLTRRAVSSQIFGNATQLYALRNPKWRPSAAVVATIEAWLAASRGEPAAVEMEQGSAHASSTESGDGEAKSETGPVGQPPSSSAPVSAAELLAEITAFCDATAVPPTRFGRIVVGDANFVKRRLREVAAVRASTAAKVREAIATPPAALVAERKPGRPHRPSPRPSPANGRGRAACDPTREPDDPAMALADKQRLNGQRHQAEIRRRQEREAAALLDAGVDPSSVKSTYQGNVMRQIQRRRADEARQADPVEIAKLALRRRGRIVFNCSVTGGPSDRFTVSGCRDEGTGKNIQFAADALIALAKRVNPKAMTEAGL